MSVKKLNFRGMRRLSVEEVVVFPNIYMGPIETYFSNIAFGGFQRRNFGKMGNI